MAECPECSTINYTPFCTNCGAEIIFKCKKCKAILHVIERHCGWCGEKNPFYLEEEEAYEKKEKVKEQRG